MIVVVECAPRWAKVQLRFPASVISQFAESSETKVSPAGAGSVIVTSSASESPSFFTSSWKGWVPAAPAVTVSSAKVFVIVSWTSSTIATVSVSSSESSSEATWPVLDTDGSASTVEATS